MLNNRKSKIILILSIGIILMLFSVTIIEHMQNRNRIKMNSIKEISMTIKKISQGKMTIEITDTTNNGNYYGGYFRIEKEIDGNWEELKKKNNNPTTMQGLCVKENNKLDIKINLNDEYDKLEKGNYRLIIRTTLPKNIPYEFSTNFEIT